MVVCFGFFFLGVCVWRFFVWWLVGWLVFWLECSSQSGQSFVPVLRRSAPQLKRLKRVWYHSEECSLITASLWLLYMRFLNCNVTRAECLCRMQLVPGMLL